MLKITFLNYLLNAGIYSDLDKKFANKIRISNRLSLMLLGLAVFYFFFFHFIGQPILGNNTVIIGLTQIFVIPFNYYRFYNLSRIHMSISNAFMCYLYSGMLGPDSGMSMFYFAAFFAPLVRFEFKEKWQLTICYFIISVFIILDVYFKAHLFDEPLFTTEAQHEIFPYLFPATFIMMIIYGKAVLKEQSELESRTLELEEKTRSQNRALLNYNTLLRENETDLKVVVNALNDKVLLFTPDLKIVKQWGKNINENFKYLNEYFSEENIQEIQLRIENAQSIEEENSFEIKENEKHFNCFLHLADTEKYVLSLSDITEKHLIREEASQRKQLLESIISNIPTDIVLFDTEHRYQLVNEVAIKDSNVRDWIIGKDDYEYCEHFNKPTKIADERRAKFQKVIEQNINIEWEEEIEQDGENKIMLRRMSPIHQNGMVKFVIGFGIDITKIKLAEKKLLNAKNIAEDNAQQKSQFLSTMSHEIRTPLNAIIGISHLLLNQELNKENLEYVNSLHFSANNLLNLINDILDYNKIDSGKLQIENRPFEFKDFIEQTLKQHEHKAQEQGNKLELVAENIPEKIYGDEIRLAQVLNNLLSNANKFTSKGTVSLIIDTIRIEENKAKISIKVKDTGIGIKKENQSKIFDSFIQENSSTTREFGGTGLGLAISKNLVELMGGKLSIESEYNYGTTFSFELKLIVSESVNQTKNNTPKKEQQFSSKHTILLVEDNQLNAMIAQKFLNQWNLSNIDFAENGEIAIQKVKENSYDLILMDLQMPIVDGYTASKEIRQLKINTPIIALTAEALLDVKQKIMESGMDSYISKPFDPKTLFATLSKYLIT